MNGEVQLIVRSGQLIEGVVIEPSTLTSSNKIGVNYFDGINNLIGMPITIIDSALNEYDGGLIFQVDFGSVFPGLWNIYYPNTTPIIDWSLGATFRINTATEYYLDLFENESISQNWQYTDLNNFQALGAFSREFRVPVTDRNQLALGALFDVNYDGGVNNYFHYKLPAEIRVDTLPIAKGYVRVRKIYQQQGKLNEVELAFYAETPDLYKAIGEKKLAALSDLPNLDEIIDYNAITTNLIPERIWTLIDRGQLWSEEGQPGTRRIFNSETPLACVDLTPALRWDYILQQVFLDAGFELEAGSLLAILAGYYMPWINQRTLYTDDLGAAYAFRAYNSNITMPLVPVDTLSPYIYYAPVSEAFDNNNDFDPTTGVYTAPGAGIYTFHGTLQLNISGLVSPLYNTFSIYFVINGTPQFYNSYLLQDALDIDFVTGINLLPGDTVKLAFRWQTPSGLTAVCTILAGTGDLGGSLFELIGTQFDYGSRIIYNLNAPDMRQIDFVNDVIKMHNCVIVPDRINPKKISIVPYNSYIGSGDDKDWNSKLDISKDITIYSTVELQKSKTTFTYTAGEDYLSKLYKDNGRIYGDYKAEGYTVNPNTTPSEFTTGDNTVQLITRSTPCGYVAGTTVVIPQFINDKNEFVLPGPRCLFSGSVANIELFNDNIGVMASTTTVIPTLCNYSSTIAELDDNDLNWAPEVPPFSIVANPYNNLFNLYWRNAMNELYSPNARIMEAYFALDLTDILTFKFNDIIYVNGAQWRILEVTDYKVGQFESTRVKLIRYLRSEADCSSTPYTVSINGVVNFVDGDGNPVASTQSCCVRYGYTWDENNAYCYAFNSTGDRPFNGISGTNTSPIPRNILPTAINGNLRSVQQGYELNIADGNNNMIAVGDTLKLDTAVRGNAMFGKNILISQPGLHLGGGWKLDDRGQNEGSTQYGIIMFGSKDVIATSGDIIQPTIENTGTHLSIPDDSYWSVMLHINVTDFNTATTYQGLYMVTFQKVGSITASTGAILVSEDNGFGLLNFAINIDTTTDTTQHRLEIVTTGTGYSYSMFTTVTLQYTAVR